MTSPSFVHIHYLRPPDRKEVFTQRLLLDTPAVKVTLAQTVPFDPPIRIQGAVALEQGSDPAWFLSTRQSVVQRLYGARMCTTIMRFRRNQLYRHDRTRSDIPFREFATH